TGATEQGYSLPGGSTQYTSLPWTNLNTLRIAFSENVNIDEAALNLLAANTQPTVASFYYDSTHFIATWTFASPLVLNANRINLDNTQVTDAAGADLDGQWADQSSTFAPQGGIGSGNGAPGSDFNFGFYTLPGDVKNQGTVLTGSTILVRNALGTSIGDSGYNYLYDVKGLGTILSSAFIAVRNDLGMSTSMLTMPSPPANHADSDSQQAEDLVNDGSDVPATVSTSQSAPNIAVSPVDTIVVANLPGVASSVSEMTSALVVSIAVPAVANKTLELVGLLPLPAVPMSSDPNSNLFPAIVGAAESSTASANLAERPIVEVDLGQLSGRSTEQALASLATLPNSAATGDADLALAAQFALWDTPPRLATLGSGEHDWPGAIPATARPAATALLLSTPAAQFNNSAITAKVSEAGPIAFGKYWKAARHPFLG
ncbi:MAG TPA: hypothetical protein VHY20_03825, partial [Pirellulales bacterium]|nr:hypothetical protein [Pirellulales bacterium]